MADLWQMLAFSQSQALFLTLVMFCAAVVRGFAGFAQSALVMATAATVLPPVDLIPMLWLQEMAASIVMARGGWRDADRKTTALLVAGNWTGWPVGLLLTTTLPASASSLTALIIILALAVLQLVRLRIPGLHTRAGTLASGFVAGIVSGIAHVGGMVVALFVLNQDRAARSMRGTLVLYLFVGALGSLIYLAVFGVMTQTALIRGVFFIPVTFIGVWLGTRLFSPRWEPYYRPFCLCLLIGLAVLGLLRLALAG